MASNGKKTQRQPACGTGMPAEGKTPTGCPQDAACACRDAEPVVRAYREADLPRLMDIGTRAWEHIYAGFRQTFGEELFKIIVPDVRTVKSEQIRRHCTEHPDRVLVCEVQGQAVAFLTYNLWQEKSFGEIGNNAVDPDWRHRGLAQLLYAAVFERFRAAGMRFARVMTGLDEAHAPARRAYERAGFNIRDQSVTYYRKL